MPILRSTPPLLTKEVGGLGGVKRSSAFELLAKLRNPDQVGLSPNCTL